MPSCHPTNSVKALQDNKKNTVLMLVILLLTGYIDILWAILWAYGLPVIINIIRSFSLVVEAPYQSVEHLENGLM